MHYLKRKLVGKRITLTTQVSIRHKQQSYSFYQIKSLLPNQETLIVSKDTLVEFSKLEIERFLKYRLIVAESYPEDEGKGVVRMDVSLMGKFNIKRGEKVLLTAPHRSSWGIGAIVLPSTHVDIGLTLLRMDSGFRGNLQLEISQKVDIQRLRHLEKAVQVTIIPAKERTKLLVKSDLLKSRLLNHLLIQEQVLIIKGKVRILPPGGYPQLEEKIKIRNIPVVIDSTIPKGIVQVDESTEVIVKKTI